MSQSEKAICVRGITKQYGKSRKAEVVLDHLDMTVEKGTIYGLLGASGCGKTTLLTCIVGRKNINSGEIWVLGGKPGTKESGVPGPRLGYMPQDISLVRQFTVKDALNHFGWIYGMMNDKIDERTEFLEELLDLPPLDSKIKNLSGGQLRKVSLAVTLIHDPELLILDEPTVGLDPVQRQRIWDFLLEIATANRRTIIITTHYVEEARQAQKIGLMRNGKLLAEDTPERLLRLYNSTNLEEVFLKLSSNQERNLSGLEALTFDSADLQSNSEVKIIKPCQSRHVGENEGTDVTEDAKKPRETPAIMAKSTSTKKFTEMFRITATGHPKALLTKNWYRITRHPGAIIFVFFFPILQLCSFYCSIGGQPQGLKLGVVNDELGDFASCEEMKNHLGDEYGGRNTYDEEGPPYCALQGLSCKFLERVTDDVVLKKPYKDVDSAIRDAKKGKIIAVIYFPTNYSKSFEERLQFGTGASNETLYSSLVSLWMDMSKRQNALLLERQFLSIQKEFLRNLLSQCEVDPKVGSLPLRFYEPVYGNSEESFSEFMTPGVITTMIFFLSLSITATIIVVERLDGIWDRTLLAGVSSTEILLSHIIIEAGVISLQVTEVIIFVFYIFRIPCVGSYFDIVVLLFLQGLCGMCGGFLVSVSCNTVTASNFISMGSFYPVLVLSGLLWPIEGMPDFLKSITVGLPSTQASLSIRNIMKKGWTLTRAYVYEGFLISILWIVIFATASIVVVRLRK